MRLDEVKMTSVDEAVALLSTMASEIRWKKLPQYKGNEGAWSRALALLPLYFHKDPDHVGEVHEGIEKFIEQLNVSADALETQYNKLLHKAGHIRRARRHDQPHPGAEDYLLAGEDRKRGAGEDPQLLR